MTPYIVLSLYVGAPLIAAFAILAWEEHRHPLNEDRAASKGDAVKSTPRRRDGTG